MIAPAKPKRLIPPVAEVIDLCSGMGGLSLAAEMLGMRGLAGVDTNATAIRTFGKNFPHAKAITGSVRAEAVLSQCEQLIDSAVSPVVIVSGPPCQGFSAAGSRNPNDPRNQILVAVARAIARLQPRCALVENVSMLLADKHDERLLEFEEVITDAGYHIAKILLDASEFGVPQKRIRAFFLITRRKFTEGTVLKLIALRKKPADSVEEVLRGLPSPDVRPETYDDEAEYVGVANHLAMLHSQSVKKKIAAIKPGNGPMSYRRLHPTRLSNTLFSGHRAPPAHFNEPRSITVREAARLQGFPDTFRIYGAFSNQMEQVTNAVPPPLACAVLEVLKDLAKLD
jgi:DNA (cytosine-5)-methyltransferase 1